MTTANIVGYIDSVSHSTVLNCSLVDDTLGSGEIKHDLLYVNIPETIWNKLGW